MEPAFAYCEQVMSNRGKGRTDPQVKARRNLQNSIDRGYAEELRILFCDMSPETLLDDAFKQWCDESVMKIWDESESIKVSK